MLLLFDGLKRNVDIGVAIGGGKLGEVTRWGYGRDGGAGWTKSSSLGTKERLSGFKRIIQSTFIEEA